MNEDPEIPKLVPPIPRGPLWRVLLAPPLVTVGANTIAGLAVSRGQLSGLLFEVPIGVFIFILIFTGRFSEIVGQRYRGPSLTFLNFSYLFGQIIVCLAVWIGSCVVLFS
ncbi:MAG: hypothetical protein ABIS50_10920 [Luteolibacter sp.]|uniref:hypothetical protein n=1 Tax=Luteolibacter sp. TaxID=1962973 RepID=UPI0032636A65